MKHNFKYYGLVLLLLLLVGCDLSKYPIDDAPVIKTDARLIGKWKEKEKKGQSDLYTLTKKSDTRYLVTVKEHDDNKRTLKYDAFLSDVNNVQFLNVLYKDDSVNGYLFLRILNINAAGNTVIAAAVSDSTMKDLRSSAAVRERIKENLNNPVFYSDTVHFIKVK